VNAGIKESVGERLDLAVLFSEKPCAATAVFTRNRVKAAPVLLCMERLRSGKASAVVVNSGSANACVGDAGLADARETARLASRFLSVIEEDVLVASTGVIGRRLPMDRIRDGLGRLSTSRNAGSDFARAIMTTDTVPKQRAVNAGDFIIGGAAKGSGMIHPDMATLLAFITTDASVEPAFLSKALQKSVDISFNMVSVDGDTSTNDMVLLMANGEAGGEQITESSPLAGMFHQALDEVCLYLAREIARDGEGATRLIEVAVNGAASTADARMAARTIVSSPLVKTAVHGCDPNWGRVMMALGRSGASFQEDCVSMSIGGIEVVNGGMAVDYSEADVARALGNREVKIVVGLGAGDGSAVAWGCDLSAEYVKINAEYTT